MNFCQYYDGDFLKKEHERLATFMYRNCIADQNTKKISFTGIINFEDTVYVFWPKNFKDTLLYGVKKNAKMMIDCIKKYSSNRKRTISLDEEKSSEPIGIPPLAALELLQDYMRYGLYQNFSQLVTHTDTGKVLWNKVIQNVLPFINQSNKPIYTEFYSRKINYNSENEITSIHAYVISVLDKIFGWYFVENEQGIAPALRKKKLAMTKIKALALLRKERTMLFADREIRLITNLIRILENDSSFDPGNNFYCGIAGFEYVWEHMCGFCFKNEKDLFMPIIPYPAYISGTFIEPQKNNRQNLDIIFSQNNTIVILDAKYYDFRVSKPGWSDLVKQFYYKRSLETVLNNKKVLNYFVVPYPQMDNLVSTAVITDSNGNRLDEEFGKIEVLYLNVQEVMSEYTSPKGYQQFRDKLDISPAKNVL